VRYIGFEDARHDREGEVMDGTLTIKVETPEHFKREMAHAEVLLAKLERALREYERNPEAYMCSLTPEANGTGAVAILAAGAVVAGSTARVSRRRLFSFGLLT
jgi:hypothetical protein